MDYWFLGKCFLVGLSASCTVGPIFILTFNNSALHGFLKGLFTALGAAIGDGILLFLGLMGALGILHEFDYSRLIIDLAGGILLVVFGIVMIMQRNKFLSDVKVRQSADTLLLTLAKSLISTILNPLTLIFFMFIGSQLMPHTQEFFTRSQMMMGSLMTTLGSLVVLSAIAYAASRLHTVITPKKLAFISLITAGILIFIGAYFVGDAVKILQTLHAGI